MSAPRIAAALGRIVTALRAQHRPFALVGGLAVSARVEPRFTRDIDLALAVGSDAEAEAVIRGLSALGYSPAALVEQDATKRLATVRLVHVSEGEQGVVTDLLFASSGVEAELAAQAEELEVLPGLTAPVARVGHLIALKLLSRDDATRPQDAVDLRALVSVATPAEIATARETVSLVARRGYARGRDLAALLAAVLGERE